MQIPRINKKLLVPLITILIFFVVEIAYANGTDILDFMNGTQTYDFTVNQGDGFGFVQLVDPGASSLAGAAGSYEVNLSIIQGEVRASTAPGQPLRLRAPSDTIAFANGQVPAFPSSLPGEDLGTNVLGYAMKSEDLDGAPNVTPRVFGRDTGFNFFRTDARQDIAGNVAIAPTAALPGSVDTGNIAEIGFELEIADDPSPTDVSVKKFLTLEQGDITLNIVDPPANSDLVIGQAANTLGEGFLWDVGHQINPTHARWIFNGAPAGGGLAGSFTPNTLGPGTLEFEFDAGDEINQRVTIPVNIVPPPVIQGDLNGDGVVNEADLRLLVAVFGLTSGDPGFDDSFDLVADGVINILDLSFLSNLITSPPAICTLGDVDNAPANQCADFPGDECNFVCDQDFESTVSVLTCGLGGNYDEIPVCNPVGNLPPELDAIGDQSVNEGQKISIPLSAFDANGDGLTFSFDDDSESCSLTDNGDGTGEINCAPGPTDSGTFQITVTVQDNGTPGLSVERTFTLTINDSLAVKQFDMALKGSCDEEGFPGEVVQCDMTIINNGLFDVVSAALFLHIAFPNFVTDIDVPNCRGILDTTLNSDGSWDASCSGFPIDSFGGFFAQTLFFELGIDPGAPDGAQVGMHFEADQEDGIEEFPDDDDQEYIFEIGQGANHKPKAKFKINSDSGSKKVSKKTVNVQTGQMVSLDGRISTDSIKVHRPLTIFEWSITERPAGTTNQIINPQSGTPTFTPDGPGIYKIKLVVEDSDRKEGTKHRRIQATGNAIPIAVPGVVDPDSKTKPPAVVTILSVTLPADGSEVTLSLDGSKSSDPGGEIKGYDWVVVPHDENNPSSSSAGVKQRIEPSNTVMPTYTTNVDGTVVITLQVTDDDKKLSDITLPASTIIITFIDETANQPPTADPTFTPASPSINQPVTFNAGASDPGASFLLLSGFSTT